jgi:hypothetical protein
MTTMANTTVAVTAMMAATATIRGSGDNDGSNNGSNFYYLVILLSH